MQALDEMMFFKAAGGERTSSIHEAHESLSISRTCLDSESCDPGRRDATGAGHATDQRRRSRSAGAGRSALDRVSFCVSA